MADYVWSPWRQGYRPSCPSTVLLNAWQHIVVKQTTQVKSISSWIMDMNSNHITLILDYLPSHQPGAKVIVK
jgi:hypothetical protein